MSIEQRLDPVLLLRLAGVSLYGLHWAGPLAKALETSPRNIYRWGSGRAPVPRELPQKLLSLCENRRQSLMTVATLLVDYELRRVDSLKKEE